MKSFTSLEQSKKLAEILPLESADTLYCVDFDGDVLFIAPKQYSGSFRHQPELIIPCWSLAALLSILPSGYVIVKNYHNFYYVESRDHEKSTNIFNNPVDACYELILKLHEQKLL